MVGETYTYLTVPNKHSILHNLIKQIKQCNIDDATFNKVQTILCIMENIRVFNTIDKPLILAKDVGMLLNIDVNQIITSYDCVDTVIHTVKVTKKNIFF